MRDTERFLRQATRGLWGQRKRDALTELRGAVEDKVYRHRLAGLNEADATLAALRDLGSPHAIARDLTRIHSGPGLLRTTLLLGVAGLLSLQAVAQINPVHATADPRNTSFCTFDQASLNRMSEPTAQSIRQQLSLPGEREKIVAACLEQLSDLGNQLLRLRDIWAAFRRSGVQVEQLPGDLGLYNLTFPEHPTPRFINLSQSVQFVGGEKYIDLPFLISVLTNSTDAPLRLMGTQNPTLRVGPATLRLGTPAAPVRASDVYTAALVRLLELKIGQSLSIRMSTTTVSSPSYRYRTAGPDGTSYAVLDNQDFVCNCLETDAAPLYRVSVQDAQGGQLSSGVRITGSRGAPVVVSTWAQLQAASQASRRALLVYRLNSADLRQVIDQPVPATQLSLILLSQGKE
jgi:hypothetical protein